MPRSPIGRSSLLLLVVVACLAAACTGTAETDLGAETSNDSKTENDGETANHGEPESDGDADDGAENGRAELELDPTLALDRGPGAPARDAHVPAEGPNEPIGRPGYSRYVYTRSGDSIIPSLVEGPRSSQTRCQAVELPCSFADLAGLVESGAEIPAALNMTTVEVAKLVGELEVLQQALARFPDPASACAAGYRPDQNQTPNMGSHFTNVSLIDGSFKPGEPEILLFARTDGAEPDGPLGTCRNGQWDGDQAEIVGAAYFVPRLLTDDQHFDGFTGPLDNWHVHYNLCRRQGQDTTVTPENCGGGTPNGPEDQPRGDASEGWMIHAWANPRFDNQLGVFSMWNPTLWPIADPSEVLDRGSLNDAARGANLIEEFELPDVMLEEPGDVQFFNADTEAHTVTAGTPTEPADLFDTGIIGGRDIDEITIAEPGEYSYFCSIHPTMQGTITVGS